MRNNTIKIRNMPAVQCVKMFIHMPDIVYFALCTYCIYLCINKASEVVKIY